MKNIRIFGWVIIAFNIYFLYQFSQGIVDLNTNSSDAASGIYIFISMIVWGVLNLILYVLYRVTGTKKRECPACGQTVKKGLTVCPSCSYDFFKNATVKPEE
jgi:glucan phosphoethanolaminetransferase (alkaline phosphatase superfamily)